MSLYFVANTTEQLHFSDTLPDYLKPLVINGASCQACAGEFGHILLQQIDTPIFCLRQIHFYFNQPTHIGITQEDPLVEIYINLGKQLQFHVHQVGNISLDTGAYNIFYSPFIKHEYFFQQGLDYKTLSIICKPQLLASLARAFPVMNKIVEKTNQQKPFMVFGGDTVVSRVTHTIREIADCTYTGELLNVFLQASIFDMLLLCLKNEQRNGKQAPLRLREDDIRLFESVRTDILRNLDKRFTLAELAKKYGISESKFARGFKHFTGHSVYDFQLHASLERSKDLLLTSDLTVSTIATESGYQAEEAYSKAFKKKYGLSPLDYRKKYGK